MKRRELLIGVAAISASGISTANPLDATRADAEFLVALDPPGAGVNVYEPHIAIDPANPDRIAVAAQYGVRGGRGGRNLQLWVSEDAGRKWFSTRVPQPKLDGEFAADALVAFHTDGSLLVAGLCAPQWVSDMNDSMSYTRKSVPPFNKLEFKPDENLSAADLAMQGGVTVARSEDGGRTLSSTLVPGTIRGDKTFMTIDRSATSAYRGSVYVSWHDDGPTLRIARSTDGGRTFAQPAVLDTWQSAAMQQIAVRPDGSVHAVWALGGMPGITDTGALAVRGTRDDAPPDASQSIYHAVSIDGGATFSEPAKIATHAGAGMAGIPTFAVDANGCLMWVWGQADALPDANVRPLLQPRHRLYAIRSEDGVQWSAPFELCPWLPAETHMALPAITSSGSTWWLLTYLADDRQTRVVLMRSDDGSRSFKPDNTQATRANPFKLHRTLAKRSFQVDQISLMSSYLLRFCDDVPQIGDYVGVAATGSRVVAAYVLPETDEPTSRATVYVVVNDT